MVESIAYIVLFGLFFATFMQRLHLPRLLGMIIAGMVIGPYCLNILDESILTISSQIRQIALIIILTRAGLTLDITDLKKVGRPAILMCFLPALIEILGMIFFAPKLLGISTLDAAIMGSVVAAVSPAVVVPKMIQLIDDKLGTEQGIPQMILAGASVDDVFVIVMFSAFTGLALGNEINALSFVQVPVSIFTGIVFGLFVGYLLALFLKKLNIRNTTAFLITISISFLLMRFETFIKVYIPFSGLLSIMAMGLSVGKMNKEVTVDLNHIYSKCWDVAQIFLFVLVGASVNISYALKAGWASVILIICVLLVRMVAVFICLIKTPLNKKERFFTMCAYSPKATVQAAMGGVPLSMGLACGEIVLTISVISILITAPFGAIMMDIFDKKCLKYASK